MTEETRCIHDCNEAVDLLSVFLSTLVSAFVVLPRAKVIEFSHPDAECRVVHG